MRLLEASTMLNRLLGLLLLILPVVADASERLISVRGEATMKVAPDQISMDIEIENTHKSDIAKAKAVVDSVSSKTARALIEAGVDPKNITSSTMTIDTAERYDQFDNPIPTGHMAHREINLLLRDVSFYSRVLQVLVDAGVTRVVDVRAEVSDYEGIRMKALGEAGRDARTKAEYLARELGTSLGKVHRIGDPSVGDRFGQIEEVVVTASKVNAPTPYEFEPGSVTVRATLYVEFELE
jgi:hypothetical protein